MPQQQRIPMLVIADVPVKISFLHEEHLMKEYEESIPVEFNPQTPEGHANAHQMHKLQEAGLSTEGALFEIASELVKKQAVKKVSTIAPELTKPLRGQSLHIHVKRNGEITYRAQQS